MVLVNGVHQFIEDKGAQTPEPCPDRIIDFDPSALPRLLQIKLPYVAHSYIFF